MDEICTADPVARELRWFVRPGNAFQESPASELLNVSVADLSGQIVWPS